VVNPEEAKKKWWVMQDWRDLVYNNRMIGIGEKFMIFAIPVKFGFMKKWQCKVQCSGGLQATFWLFSNEHCSYWNTPICYKIHRHTQG
jgi:hypothetical protein